jgi:hypothetical protein
MANIDRCGWFFVASTDLNLTIEKTFKILWFENSEEQRISGILEIKSDRRLFFSAEGFANSQVKWTRRVACSGRQKSKK